LDVTRLSDDTFAAWYSESGHEVLVTFDGQQHVSKPTVLPDGGPVGWGGCEGSSRYVACIGQPGVDEKNLDEMAFTGVLVIDLESGQTFSFPVGHQTHFHFNPAQAIVYVTDHTTTGSERKGVVGFDINGNSVGPAQPSDMAPSPSGRFAETLPEDGAESWAIYDVKTQKTIFDFNCDKPAVCRLGDRSVTGEHDWNPMIPDQIVVLGDAGKAYGAGSTCDVYDVSKARLVKSVSCGGLPVYDWSRDGKELVTLAYMDGVFHRERVN